MLERSRPKYRFDGLDIVFTGESPAGLSELRSRVDFIARKKWFRNSFRLRKQGRPASPFHHVPILITSIPSHLFLHNRFRINSCDVRLSLLSFMITSVISSHSLSPPLHQTSLPAPSFRHLLRILSRHFSRSCSSCMDICSSSKGKIQTYIITLFT